MERNRVQDGAHCRVCGLANYSGVCPYCRADAEEFHALFESDQVGEQTVETDAKSWDNEGVITDYARAANSRAALNNLAERTSKNA